MKPALRPMETRWRACDRLPSKQAVAGSHPNDWLLDSPLEGEAGQECLVCPPICIKLRTAELRIAQTSQDTVHWMTCLALKRLRRGSAQQPSKVTQCSSNKPKSLAYSSVKMR